MNIYMAELMLPEYMNQDLINLIPSQRAHVDGLLSSGTIQSYSLAMDRSRLWVVLLAENQTKAETILDEFPIREFVTYSLTELAFHNDMKVLLPKMSLN